MRKTLVATVLAVLCPMTGAADSPDQWAETEGWFTLHHDVMRSGRTHYSPAGPFKHVWHRKFFEGMLSAELEPIVAEGKVFLGDWGGKFYALDAFTGKEAWTRQAVGGVRHAACYDPSNGTILYATIGDRTGGAVVSRKAATGELAWEFRPHTRGGFATSPALYDRKVYIGGRDKVLYCLDARTGKKLWTHRAAGIYLQTCAARDGRVVVAAEDMIPRCFDARTGDVFWEGPKMRGDTVRFYYPVFWKDTVIFRTAAPDNEINRYQSIVQAGAGEDGKKLAEVHEKYEWSKEYFDWNSRKYKLYTPEKYAAEQKYVMKAITEGRLQKTFYMLSVSDGKERMITSVGYSGSENGYSTPTPPCVDAAGNLYVLYKTFYTQYEYPIRAFDCIGTLDYETGIPKMLPRTPPGHRSLFPITADEANMFTWGGGADGRLYNTHDHNFAYWEAATRRVLVGFAPKTRAETWGGILLTGQRKDLMRNVPHFHLESPGAHLAINNEWNGTSCGSVAIYEDHVWWTTGSMIVCLEGASK